MNSNFTKTVSIVFAVIFSCSVANAKIFSSKKAAPEKPAASAAKQTTQTKKQVVKEIINDTIEVRVIEPAAVTDESAKETIEAAKEELKETAETTTETTVNAAEDAAAKSTADSTVETTVIKEETATTIFNIVKPEIEVNNEQPAVGEKSTTDAVKTEVKEEAKTEPTAKPAVNKEAKEAK